MDNAKNITQPDLFAPNSTLDTELKDALGVLVLPSMVSAGDSAIPRDVQVLPHHLAQKLGGELDRQSRKELEKRGFIDKTGAIIRARVLEAARQQQHRLVKRYGPDWVDVLYGG